MKDSVSFYITLNSKSTKEKETPPMGKSIIEAGRPSSRTYDMLEEMVWLKVQEFIQDILNEEIAEFLGRGKSKRKRGIDIPNIYRNGMGKPRRLALMNGTVTIRRPRLRDIKGFESKILPLFKRRTKELTEMLPKLYLHGLANGDFELALRGLLGEGAPLSASSIQRLKGKWQAEYKAWKDCDLSELQVVYLWADGIYVKGGLEKDKAALLMIIGALRTGEKKILACESGYRESKESWSEVLRSLTVRGLKLGRLTIADGYLGIWSALSEIHPEGDEQRCWNHKIINVLDALPKSIRAEAAAHLCKIPYAQTKEKCVILRDAFAARYRKDYPKAVEKLLRELDQMVSFYSYPKDHWIHIRTTNIVESPFSYARLRTDVAKRYKKVENATVMLWKLLQVAEKNFRALNSPHLLADVYAGKQFVNGEIVIETRSLERMAA